MEITPLHSNARGNKDVKKLSKEAMKYWLVPSELIREYYGDEVAMYFEWMNYFICNFLYLINHRMAYLSSIDVCISSNSKYLFQLNYR